MIGALLAAVVCAQAGGVGFEGEGHAYHPVFSPDGARVAFEVNRYAGNVDLFVAELAGASAGPSVRVPHGVSSTFGAVAVVATSPVFLGRGLIYEGTQASGRVRLFTWAPPGPPREVVRFEEVPGDLAFPVVASATGVLAWVGGAGGADLWVRDRQGVRRLGHTPASEAFPSLTAEGQDLLITRQRGGGEDIFAVDVRSGQARLLVEGPGDQTRPVRAADGAVVYFDGSAGDRWDLVARTESSARVVARDVRLPLRARPALSPDGRWVAYAPKASAHGHQVVIARVDGSAGPVPIETGRTACGEPALAAQGDRLLLAFTALPAKGASWRGLEIRDITGRLPR